MWNPRNGLRMWTQKERRMRCEALEEDKADDKNSGNHDEARITRTIPWPQVL